MSNTLTLRQALAFALSTIGLVAFAPASNATDIGPIGSQGRCFFVDDKGFDIDYNDGTSSLALLRVQPWFGLGSGTAELLDKEYKVETGKSLRFSYDASTTQTNQLRNWYWTRGIERTNFYENLAPGENSAKGFAQGYEILCLGQGALAENMLDGLLEELSEDKKDDIIDQIKVNNTSGSTGTASGQKAEQRKINQARIGRLISNLLFPRNVIASGGLVTQAYVNDLADTILERLPTRQFQKLQVDDELKEVEAKEPSTEPVRGLWKTSDSSSGEGEIATTQFGGDFYIDNPNLTSIYTEPHGTRVWARGFGGSMSPYDTGGAYGKRGVIFYPDVYNNFYSTHSGLVVGVDTSLTENIQLGIFGNYGNINLTQFAGRYTGGGSWNPSGFGGGVMASYWEDNFYVQGAFGATAFSGDNKRQIKVGNFLNETYTASKYTTAYMGTVRVGAPFSWGGVIVEPQATAIWNHNQDASYTESGKYRALAIKLNSYTDNFLRTALGAKLAWPIQQGTRNLLVPNIKVAWLADWDTNNGAVSFKRAFTRRGRKARTAEIPSNQETQYGVLLEGGVDYAIAQGPTTAWKLYTKGGAKLWVNKAADWRTSGGITFQF